ncbi:MAG: type I glyceraldehyde-3-phosphate dehydrogenase [Bacteroidetes bacterium]|nr:type I glyceraldehyde-3-phosphate dehydrogenase [Bacteroidota bacterium]MCL5027363.1 type I glyceraldehyde-3-phosphate dehydrogenase [Chloroflexota bacterium]
MAIRIGINGFGRIGRMLMRAGIDEPVFEFVAVNDIVAPHILAHLFQYDSVHGPYKGEVQERGGNIVINGREIKVLAERDPGKLPWNNLGVDIVIESTGRFTDRQDAIKHIEAGAKRVVVSAPAKDPDLTVVMGINEDQYDPKKHFIISNASCTTNCLATVVKPLVDKFGFQRGFFNTTHAYTADQRLVDAPHSDLRRARAAALNIIPTSSGAAVAAAEVVPQLKGKMTGLALRTPTADGSILDLTMVMDKAATAAEINQALREAAAQPRMQRVMAVWDRDLVSSDIVGTTYSSIVDTKLTSAIDNLAKVMAWYDNEFGFAVRLCDLAQHVAERE